MADDVSTYQAKVGRIQGGDKFYIKTGGALETAGQVEVASGGELEMLSGSIMDCQTGFSFYFEDADMTVTAQEMRTFLARQKSARYCAASVSVAGADFSVVNLPSTVGVVFLSMGSNTTAPSFYLTSCVAGQDVWIRMAPGSVVSGVINILGSGCSIVGSLGLAITSISLYNSAASVGAVHLKAFQDDEWTIVDWYGDNTTETA